MLALENTIIFSNSNPAYAKAGDTLNTKTIQYPSESYIHRCKRNAGN